MEVSNLQELKDAAIELMQFTCNSCERRFCEEDVEEEDGQRAPSLCSAIIRMRNALSAANPIRNCDVGSAEEQAERFRKFCNAHTHYNGANFKCYKDCPARNYINGWGIPYCQLKWAQMPYEEGAEQ